jgi:hypothetical protein
LQSGRRSAGIRGAGSRSGALAVVNGRKRPRDLLIRKLVPDRGGSIKRRPGESRKNIGIVSGGSTTLVANTDRGTQLRRPRRLADAVYEDRTFSRHRDRSRYFHVYRDGRDRLCHRLIRPRFSFGLCYNFGRRFAFRRVYPYYHRRYVFVSIGGYWPYHYTYPRYYRYPCHLYYWHGYHPIARQVRHDTCNYYVYNYYGYGTDRYGAPDPVDHTTFRDIREKLQAEKEPGPETMADVYFDQGVKAFETGDYELAAQKFALATKESPDDVILPFALAQALFAGEKYEDAVLVLRVAIEAMPGDEAGVFFPRGLYKDENTLFEQVERLGQRAEAVPADFDLQFLLGYQLLGAGSTGEALEPLRKAAADPRNKESATVLLELAEELLAAGSAEGGDTEGTVE